MIESNAATVTPPWISQPDVDSLFHYIFSHRNLSPPFAYDVNHMAILDTISCRWIPRRALLLLFLLLFLLQSIPYGSSQITPPRPETKANDPVVIVITVMFFVVFVMVFGSIFCRRSSSPFYSRPSVFRSTDADAESRVVRIRRNTAARGLDAEAIKSFPVFVYSDVKTVRIGKGGVECAVCLSEFEDDETLRLLPPCCHVFHADCVDVWLSDHSTCPLCRADLLVLEQQQGVESYQILDPGTVSSGSDPERGVSESSDAHLLDGVTSTNSNTTPRSKSTGLSSWRITGILVPRSHSTGHSLVQPAGDLDRFTLRLPDDVRRQLMKTTGHMALPQARSSRSGYRSGSVGSERGVFSYGRKNHNYNRRLHSLSFSFSFRSGSVRSTFGGEAVAPPKNFPASSETGERSFERLRPDDRV